MLSHRKTVMASGEILTAPKTVFSQQAFCWEPDSVLCVCVGVCVYVFYLEGSVDFNEGVEGGQVKLSDLPPVTWLDGTLHILPGNTNTHTHTMLKTQTRLGSKLNVCFSCFGAAKKWAGFDFPDFLANKLITVLMFLGPSLGDWRLTETPWWSWYAGGWWDRRGTELWPLEGECRWRGAASDEHHYRSEAALSLEEKDNKPLITNYNHLFRKKVKKNFFT